MSEVLEAPARPAFANFVGGTWAESASGETYEKRGPWRPSEPIGAFPASGEADVDRAVAAAKDAFPAWAGLPAAQRGAVLARAADAVDRRVEQIAQDMTLEMGKPIREARLEAARMAQILRFFAGEGYRSTGERFEQAATGSVVYTTRRPLGRRRADHAVELPGRHPRVEGRAGARVREHRRHEARPGGAADRPPPRRLLRGGGHSRPASSTSSSAAARPSARRSSRTRTCARSRSPAPCRSASRCAARQPRSASASSSSSAATTPPSSWPMPTSTARRSSCTPAPSGRPARSAPPPAASTSRTRSTTTSSSGCWRGWSAAWWATRPIRRRRSARSSTRAS